MKVIKLPRKINVDLRWLREQRNPPIKSKRDADLIQTTLTLIQRQSMVMKQENTSQAAKKRMMVRVNYPMLPTTVNRMRSQNQQ